MMTLAERNEELIAKHDEIWTLMGLSARVGHELNAVVLCVNAQMSANRDRNPEVYDRVFKDSKRTASVSREEYLSDHLRRWTLLRLSDEAQFELRQAAEFCWTALHDADLALSAPDREKAQMIRRLMKELGGPPPCCDDQIFEKAKAPA